MPSVPLLLESCWSFTLMIRAINRRIRSRTVLGLRGTTRVDEHVQLAAISP